MKGRERLDVNGPPVWTVAQVGCGRGLLLRGLLLRLFKPGVRVVASSCSKVVLVMKKRIASVEANRSYLTASWRWQQTRRSIDCEVLEPPRGRLCTDDPNIRTCAGGLCACAVVTWQLWCRRECFGRVKISLADMCLDVEDNLANHMSAGCLVKSAGGVEA
jgi:hypothetical protein